MQNTERISHVVNGSIIQVNELQKLQCTLQHKADIYMIQFVNNTNTRKLPSDARSQINAIARSL